MKIPEVDAVVIGAGAGGAASAWALCRQGLRVLVLEAGPSYDPYADYRLHREEWEQSGFPDKSIHKPFHEGRPYTFGEMQPLDPARADLFSWNHISGRMNPTDKRYGWKYHHVRGVGGSTLHFAGESHRLHPAAMKMHSDFGVAADWPLDYAELEPWYVEAEKIIGVAGPAQDAVRYRSSPSPLPAHAPAYASTKIIEGTREAGYHWQANSLAILSRPYDGRPACNYCANCSRGCPRKDKGSADVTFMHKALATGRCTLLPQSQVLRLNAGARDRVESVEFIDPRGEHRRIDAAVVIVACGAVETPRLLLLSKNEHAPDGLANETGHVGRHFMETLSWVSSGLHPEALGSHRGVPSDIICWDYNAPDAIPGVVGGCRFSTATAESDLIGPLNYANRVVPGWGRAHKQAMREQFGRVLSLGAMGESLPNRRSYIDLDHLRQDAWQRPLARINSWLEPGELERLQFMADKTREMLRAARVEQLIEEYGKYDIFSSTHVFGTARMGLDPASSVVDRWQRAHRWQNLYVADASVFPSSGGGESPSLTIAALALRMGAHIAAQAAG